MVKVDPTAQDRIWKSQIEKEERAAERDRAKREGEPLPTKVGLNTVGTAQAGIAAASVSHLAGGGVMVRRKESIGKDFAPPKEDESGSTFGGSVAGSKASRGTGATGATGRTGTTEKLMNRLAFLEHELMQERQLREATQVEMQHLAKKVEEIEKPASH